MLPIGGYCAMEGEDEDTGAEDSFVQQGFWKKFIILVAGSFMNFLTGVVILLCLYAGTTEIYTDVIIGTAPEFTQTGENGFQAGDQVYKVNGYRTYLQGEAKMFLDYAGETAAHRGRAGTAPISCWRICPGAPSPVPTAPPIRASASMWVSVFRRRPWPRSCSTRGIRRWISCSWCASVLVQLFTGGAGLDDISGPVGIVSTMTEVGSEAETASERLEPDLLFRGRCWR